MRIGEHPQCGFAYVFLLVLIAVMGVAASASVQFGATLSRRDAEQQLLFIGAEFERALRSYASGSTEEIHGAALEHGPKSLGELLKDSRVAGIRRHLRQLYADPLTGRAEWGLATDPHGCIIGIYSLAAGTPIKQSDFGGTWSNFGHARTYEAWLFGSPAAQAEFKLRTERTSGSAKID